MYNDLMHRRVTVAVIWFSLGLGALYLYLFEPGRTGFFPGCPFRYFTGFTCPGCGTTRALHQLVHGHLEAAFFLNPLLILALPFMFAAFLRHTFCVFTGRIPQPNALPAAYIYTLFFVVLSFWIFRNTPFYPFNS
jgi:hypothetical protein